MRVTSPAFYFGLILTLLTSSTTTAEENSCKYVAHGGSTEDGSLCGSDNCSWGEWVGCSGGGGGPEPASIWDILRFGPDSAIPDGLADLATMLGMAAGAIGSFVLPTTSRGGRAPKNDLSEPVDGDGEFTTDETDISFPGFGLPYQFTRTYRSGAQYAGVLGFGWDHNYNQMILGSTGAAPGVFPDQPVKRLSSGFPVYHTGSMQEILFDDARSTFAGGITTYYYYPSDPRLPYQLIFSTNTGIFTLTNLNTGVVSTFREVIDSAVLLDTVTGPTGGTISVHWGWVYTGRPEVEWVTDTTGRNISYKYENGFLKCLSASNDCKTPLVSFDINSTDSTAADFGELKQVRKGSDSTGVNYQYHHGELPVQYLPSASIDAFCKGRCVDGTDSTCPDTYNMCVNMASQSLDVNSKGTIDYSRCRAFCLTLCLDGCAPPKPNQQSCVANCATSCPYTCNDATTYTGPHGDDGYYQQCLQWMAQKLPYCQASLIEGNPQNCLSTCRSYYAPPAGIVYALGVPTALNHNLELVTDGLGRTIIRNTYDSNPGHVSFDKVIDQQWGETQHVTFEYHDLALEKQFAGSSAPSIPNPLLDTIDSFRSRAICSCDAAGNCAPPFDDTTASPPTQSVKYATVTTDIRGAKTAQYFNSAYLLMREVNLQTGETKNYNYKNGRLVGMQEASGVRTCSVLDSAGHPLQVNRYPATGHLGEQSSVQQSYSWDGALLTQYVEDTSSTSKVTYHRQADGKPHAIDVAVDSNATHTTTFTYDGTFYPSSITSNGSVTKLNSYDQIGAAPSVIITDATGPSPLVRYRSYDPIWGALTFDAYYDGSSDRGSLKLTYDGAGRIATKTRHMLFNDAGVTTSYQYNAAQQPSNISDPNQTALPIFDTNNNQINTMEWPTQPGDPTLGRRTCNHFDIDGRLLETVHPEGDSTVYSYDAAGRLTQIQRGFNPNLKADNWSSGCALEHVPPPGDPGLQTVASWSYAPGGFLRSFMKDGVTYDVQVDGFGRVIEAANAIGVKARKGYDRRGRVIWEAVYQDAYDPTCKKHVPPNCPESIIPQYGLPQFGDPGLMSATEFAYDNLGRVTSVSRWHLEDHTKRVTTTVYDETARTITVTEGGRVTATTLDGAGRVVRVVLPDGSVQSTAYSNNGAKSVTTTQTNVGPVVTERDYDALELLTSVNVNGQNIFSEAHDFDGRPLSRNKEAEGFRTFTYDAFRRRAQSLFHPHVKPGQRARPAITSYTWDGDDRLTSTTDSAGAVTASFFDGLSRVMKNTDALGRDSTFTYELGTNQIATAHLPSGTQQTNTYDLGGRLGRIVLHSPSEPVDEVKTFTYTTLGQMHTAAITGAPFGLDNTVTFAYDSLGRTFSEINSYTNIWVSHNYDLYDQWKSTWVGALQAGTPQMNHIYDPLRRLSYVDVRGKRFATFNYGSSGSGGPLSSTFPQVGESTKWTYDARDRQIGIDVTGGNGKLLASQHDVLGTDGVLRQRQYSARMNPQLLSDFFQLDGSGHVTAENLAVPGAPLLSGAVDDDTVAPYMQTGSGWRSFGVDSLGNIRNITTPAGTETRTYNALNQLTADSAASSIQYDAADNLTTYATSPSSATLTFDAEKHPVSTDGPSGNLVHVSYDALGRRIAENENGNWTFFVWDGPQVIAHGYTVTQIYLDVPGDGLDNYIAYDATIENGTGFGNGAQVYLHRAPDKSLLARTHKGGLLTSYSYSAFGEPRTYGPVDNAGSRFLFQGMLYDSWTGTYSMRAREFHATLGRFLSTDPIGFAGGTNLYAFASGNPLAFSDPFGLSPKPRTDQPVLSGPETFAVLALTGAVCPECLVIYGLVHIATHVQSEDDTGQIIAGLSMMAGATAPEGANVASLDTIASREGQSAADLLNLNKSIASESQVSELMNGEGTPIAGAGTSTPLRDVPRLTSEYGGSEYDWAKIRSSNYTASDGASFETHAYQNMQTGQVVEPKTKFQ